MLSEIEDEENRRGNVGAAQRVVDHQDASLVSRWEAHHRLREATRAQRFPGSNLGPALTDIKRPSSSSIKQPATGLDALGGQPPA
jgi:hypothetical protein